MDHYHIWCNLKAGVSDVDFCARVEAYLGMLSEAGRIEGFQITRRKLGFGPRDLGEFHIVIEAANLAQLDEAFREVSRRSGRIEELHAAVNKAACDVTFALYRDFPDEQREVGEEKF